MKMTMRKMLAILATLTILCAVLPLGSLFSAVAEGDNLIVNGGFENGNEGWNIGDNSSVVTDAAHEGGAALKMENLSQYGIGAEQWIGVDADSEYTLTWYSKRLSGTGAFNVYLMNGAEGYANLTVISGENWMNKTSTDWIKHQVVVKTMSANMIVKFSSETNNAGSILIDDVTLTKVGGGGAPVVPSNDPILSENFENGSALNSSSAIAVEDGALKFTVNNDWGNVYADLKTQAGTDYVISFKAKAQIAGKTLMVKFIKNDWMTVVNQASVSVDTEWKEYSVTVNTKDYTTPIMLFQYDGVAGDGQIYWFDDVLVAPSNGDEPDTPDTPDTPDVPADGNLLKNGDFENELEGWENLWGSCTVSFVEGYNSAKALSMQCGQWQMVRQNDVPVEPNTDYVLTAYVKNATNLQLSIKTAADQNLSGASVVAPTGSEWTKCELVFNTISETSIRVLLMGSDNGCSAIVDNVVLVKKGDEPDTPDTPDTPDVPDVSAELINGGFEKGNEGWTFTSSASIYTEDAYEGSASLKLENPDAWGEAALQNVAVKPNTEYVIETYTKRVSGSGSFNLILMNTNGYANLKVVEGQSWFNTNDADWTKRTFVVDTGAATQITFKWTAEANNAGILLVDNMAIYEKGEEPPEPELPMNGAIANGDFETGDYKGWENLYGSCVVSVNESSRYTGKYGLDFTAPGDWNQVVQVAAVEPDTEYTLIVWAANAKNVQFIVKKGDDSGNIASTNSEEGNEWKKYEVKFNSGDNKAVRVLIIGAEGGGSALVDNVGLYKTGEEPEDPNQPDDPVLPPISLSLDSFGTILNRPSSEEVNLIANSSFEKAEGGQWQELVGDTFYVVDDETAPDGNKSLFFNTTGVEEQTKLIFWLNVTPNEDYVFSAWLKGAFISDDNRYDATIGVVDPNGNFLVFDGEKFSNKDRQIVPPCWDNEWHLRSVSFNSGRAEQVGICFSGKLSQLWIDSIALTTTNDAVRYADPDQFSYVGALPSSKEYGGCADEDNLIPDANMDSDESVEFWSSAIGFENGFVTFPENKYEYGTSMKYTQSSAPGGVHAIKWIDVKPNTSYTFSVDIRVVKDGGGRLVLMDNKLRVKEDFVMIDFDQFYYGVDWFNVTSEFNTGNFDRIGIAVVDGGGEALIDNMRLFESENMIEGGVKDKYVEPPYSFGEPESPDTGVSVMGIVLAVAVVPTSAAMAMGLRRKKEDEE